MQRACDILSFAECPALQYFTHIFSQMARISKGGWGEVIEHKMGVLILCSMYI